jgi:hypothetical protein
MFEYILGNSNEVIGDKIFPSNQTQGKLSLFQIGYVS